LRAAILANTLTPGTRLMPQQLAEQLGVSTMPVRQALMRLEAERLAIRMSNGALLVAPLSVKEVEEIYALRVVLEGMAARLAAPRLGQRELDTLARLVDRMEGGVARGKIEELVDSNREFHFFIYRAANHERMFDVLKNLWDVSSRYRSMFYRQPGVPEQTLKEHRGILAALQRNDAVGAKELVRSDMEATARVLVAQVRDRME
jgi:DNA-binding GntR family transcriptional regulator